MTCHSPCRYLLVNPIARRATDSERSLGIGIGYLPLDQASANWIFQVVSRRYEKGSVNLTSNRGFGDWVRSSPIRW